MASADFLNELLHRLANAFLFIPVCLFSLAFWTLVARGAGRLLRFHLKRLRRFFRRKQLDAF